MRPRVAIGYSRPSREGYHSERSSEGKESGAIKNRGGGEGGREGCFFQKGAKLFCMRVLYRKTATEWKNSSSSSSVASAVVAKTGGDSFRRSLSKDFSTCNGEKK